MGTAGGRLVARSLLACGGRSGSIIGDGRGARDVPPPAPGVHTAESGLLSRAVVMFMEAPAPESTFVES